MGYIRHRIGVIVLSAVAGILYSTLFTIPYLLISKYHASNTVCLKILLKINYFFIEINSSADWTDQMQMVKYAVLVQMLLL
jgi:hypothetical protein